MLVGGGFSRLKLTSWLECLASSEVVPPLSEIEILPSLLLGALEAVLIPLEVLSMSAGIEARRRRHWRFSLAGSICGAAVIPTMGLPATVLLPLSRSEFINRVEASAQVGR